MSQASFSNTRTGLSRPLLAAAAIIGAAAVNLLLFLAFRSAGADYSNTAGVAVGVPNVLVMTVVPLLIGVTAVLLLARGRPALLRFGRWGGAVLALLTIAMTAAAGFDPVSFLALALMHVVVAAAVATALRPGRGNATAQRGGGTEQRGPDPRTA